MQTLSLVLRAPPRPHVLPVIQRNGKDLALGTVSSFSLRVVFFPPSPPPILLPGPLQPHLPLSLPASSLSPKHIFSLFTLSFPAPPSPLSAPRLPHPDAPLIPTNPHLPSPPYLPTPSLPSSPVSSHFPCPLKGLYFSANHLPQPGIQFPMCMTIILLFPHRNISSKRTGTFQGTWGTQDLGSILVFL